MTWRSLTLGLLAAVGFLAWAASAKAQDTVRLKLTPTNDAPTLTLRSSGDDAVVTDVRYRGGYGGHGGYRGFGGYGYRGFGYGGYGYRGFGFAYYPRNYGYGYVGAYYAPPVYYYSAPSVYYAPYCAISTTTVAAPSFSLRVAPSTAIETLPPPQGALPPGAPRTYPYDGGPALPVPMPQPIPESTHDLKAPPSVVPDRSVSLPASGGSKFAYPAYGDTSRQTEFAADRADKKNTAAIVKKTTPR